MLPLEPLMHPVSLLASIPQEHLFVWDQGYSEKYTIMIRLLLAAVMGGLMGWERGRAEKPVGIRTMLLISVGAAAFALLGQQMIGTHADLPAGMVRTDPTRVLAYIISGVGFLGAGAILHSKRSIKGLTTAASIWVSAAIGAACGLGQYTIGLFLFAIAYVALWSPWVKALATGTLEQDQPVNLRDEEKK